ncbi:hypothetical protein [Sinorhizobium meliloti]|uniref:hypothetical protein n=1 Tax=Rhizobium meliloti TaxID=382 RepID=UPI001F3C0303|nr:hypothetical protein [Sinorhizobium meliloti]
MSDEIGDNDPISLAMAAKLFFHGTLTKSALRTEARKGNLEIIRIANKEFVTRNAIRQMIDRCRVPARNNVQLREASPAGQVITAQQAVRARLAAAKASNNTPGREPMSEADRIREKLFLESLTSRNKPKRGQ